MIASIEQSKKTEQSPIYKKSIYTIESENKIIRDGLLVVFLFFGLLGGWSFFGRISGAVVVPGTVKIEAERKTVQHLEGGIIDKIFVKEGQLVKEGDTLITLKSVSIDSNVDIAINNLISLYATRARFLSELQLLTEISWETSLIQLANKHHREDILENEQKIFDARSASYISQVELFENQVAQLEFQVLGLNEELGSQNDIIRTLSEELSSKKKLLEKKYLEKSQILELERELASYRGSKGKLQQSISTTEQQKIGILLQKEALTIALVEEAANEISKLEKQILQAEEELNSLQDVKNRLNIVAPVTGRIVGLQIHSNDGVITPSQPLLDIAPEDAHLVAEVHVPVDKITDIYIGQDTKVQLDAFDISTTPLIQGKISHISADRQEKDLAEGQAPFYLSYVEIQPQSLKDAEKYLTAGMPVTVFITTKEKTIFTYITEPLLKSWEKALRD